MLFFSDVCAILNPTRVHIKPAFHCNKNKQVCEARAMFGRIARGGGRINIGRKGGWNVKRAMLCLLSIHYAYEKQTHKGEELFKRTKRVSWCLKGLQKSLIIETFCSSRIWREYGLFTFVQVYMHVQLFRALPVSCSNVQIILLKGKKKIDYVYIPLTFYSTKVHIFTYRFCGGVPWR